MVCGAACNDADLAQVLHLPHRERQPCIAFLRCRAAGAERVLQRRGLLVDLLEHVVRIAAFFCAGQVPIHMEHRMLSAFAVCVVYADALSVQNGDLLVLQKDHIARMAQQRRDVRCDKPFSILCADDERAVVSGAIEPFRLLIADHAQGIAAFQHAHGADERLTHIAGIQMVEQMRHDLGIGLAYKARPCAFQIAPERLMVLDDTIMNDRDAAFYVRMRVRVQVAGLAMCGPSRVPDTHTAVNRAL